MTEPGGGPIDVLIVIDSLGQGGAEQSTVAVLPHLAALGIRPHLLCLRATPGAREDEVRAHGIEVQIAARATIPGLARELHRRARRDGLDLVHVALFNPTLSAAVGTLGTGVPLLVSIVNTRMGPGVAVPNPNVPPWKGRAVDTIEAFAWRHLATHLHAVTPGVARRVAEEAHVPRSRITVVERGRSPERFRPPEPGEREATRAELGLAPEAEVVLAVGRHEHQKSHIHLVEAAAALQPHRPQLHVLVAGREGNASAAVRAAIAAMPDPSRFHLLGDRSDIERVLGASDVFALPSLREGAAGAAVEALGCGVPVVSTRLDGLEGILEDGVNARIVPVADPAALAAGIEDLLDHPDLAASLAEAGRRTFLERFTIDRAVVEMAQLYRDVAAGGRRRRG